MLSFKEGTNCENNFHETYREKNKVLLVVPSHTVVNPSHHQRKRERENDIYNLFMNLIFCNI